ncbi:MAG: hypothetical protein PHC28_12575 [Flavobacterium sp.]|nr:hypothetical protein [Flavobacterium sp.]
MLVYLKDGTTTIGIMGEPSRPKDIDDPREEWSSDEYILVPYGERYEDNWVGYFEAPRFRSEPIGWSSIGSDLVKILTFEYGGETTTIKDYIKELLLKLWEDPEGFNGKRPFGNSGWKYDIFATLIKNGIIEGELDEDGYINKCDDISGDMIIENMIKDIFK